MIDFRYHVVSIVAVFLALTVGIVLGSSLLGEPLARELQKQSSDLRRDNQTLHQQKRDLERDVQYRDTLVEQVSPTLLADRLAGHRVVLVTLPGADSKITGAIGKTITGPAGGTVTGQVAIKGEFVDVKQQTTLGALAAQLKPTGVTIPDGSPQATAAAEIADAVLTAQPDSAGQGSVSGATILGGLEEAGFIEVEGSPQERADLAVVVASSVVSASSEDNETVNEAHLAVLTALNKAGRGAVLAGTEQAAEDGGLVAALRRTGQASREVSSVDIADSASGRLAVALALLAETRGKSGHYGVHGRTDGPLPPVLAQSGG